ncbi:hypothetical protein [Pontibacter sp. G13]|uniref:hypothetical protein n=1 Tax=Pontibacter sp. G13 TaxID=3074898 RepID=UPI00288A852D|nr:hypothetical protein [Pontibacter sp. G13]WNJ17625.1 hypothetical protein RJD25_22470 [Pontibacter sp. G13]
MDHYADFDRLSPVEREILSHVYSFAKDCLENEFMTQKETRNQLMELGLDHDSAQQIATLTEVQLDLETAWHFSDWTFGGAILGVMGIMSLVLASIFPEGLDIFGIESFPLTKIGIGAFLTAGYCLFRAFKK